MTILLHTPFTIGPEVGVGVVEDGVGGDVGGAVGGGIGSACGDDVGVAVAACSARNKVCF